MCIKFLSGGGRGGGFRGGRGGGGGFRGGMFRIILATEISFHIRELYF